MGAVSHWKPTKRSKIMATKAEIMEMVKAHDKDGNGFICAAELIEILKTLGHGDSNVELQNMKNMFMRMGDFNEDKKLSIKEVGAMFDASTPIQKLQGMFRMVDSDGSGFVCLEELTDYLKLISIVEGNEVDEKELKEKLGPVMTIYDANKDGKLSYKEFCEAFEK